MPWTNGRLFLSGLVFDNAGGMLAEATAQVRGRLWFRRRKLRIFAALDAGDAMATEC